MRIYVGGSLRNIQKDEEQCIRFAEALGVEVVKQGHSLMNGCRSTFDEAIARAAQNWLETSTLKDREKRIVSYHMDGENPIHRFGDVKTSALANWKMSQPRLIVPEQIEKAAATIFVAGNEGTYWAKNWAYYARKPILGVPRFGGAAEDIYHQELERLRRRSPSVADDFETLNRLSEDMTKHARQVVDLAERLVIPRSVFVIMSFKQEYFPLFESFVAICKKLGFIAERTDQSASLDRITSRIENGIRFSPFVIADLSDRSANVMYEVGFARALGKNVILTAKEGTTLPFDTHDMPTIFWREQTDLRKNLRKRISLLVASFHQ